MSNALATSGPRLTVDQANQASEFIRETIGTAFVSGGRAVIRNDLLPSDRSNVAQRLRDLMAILVPARNEQIAPILSQFMLGFGTTRAEQNDKKAAAVLSQYAKALRGLPLFAIQRACDRFAGGHVSTADLGDGRQTYDKAHPPSTAQLVAVATKEAFRYREERDHASLLLAATVDPPEETPEQRARMGKLMQDLADSMKMRQARTRPGAAITPAQIEAVVQASADRRSVEILRQYDREGIEPIRNAAGDLVSLSFALSIGWTVHEADGKRVLVAPVPDRPRGATRPNEMGR